MNFENNSIIENINEKLKKLKIQKLKDFKNFMLKTKTEQADIIMTQMKEYIIANDKIIYYYNEKLRLWLEVDENQYNKYIYDFLLNTTKHIRNLMKNEDLEDEEKAKINKFLSGCFDEDKYITTIIKRSFTLLYNSNFIPLLDSAKEFFPIKNGRKINFKTLEITQRTNKDFFTYESPVDFVDKTPNADKFFEQLFTNQENREYVRRVLGYTITAETFAQVFFIWYGFGSNGKSLLSKILELILCKQYCQCDENIFIKNKKQSGQATPELMNLLGKRGGFYSEGETADNVEMNEGSLKRISGEDKLTGRYLFSNTIEFYPYIKLHMLTNFIPSLSADNAMKRRIRYLFFDNKFVNNPLKPNEFKIDLEFTDKIQKEYLPEVFSWIAKGAFEVYKTKDINMSNEYISRTNKLLDEGDSIECFIKRKIIKTDKYEDTIKKNELFDFYKSFCNENSQRCIARSTLWARISQNGFNTRTLHGCDVYFGISINFKNNEEVNPIDYGLENNNIELNDDKDLKISNLENKLKELEAQLLKLQSPKAEEHIIELNKPYEKELTDEELEKELEELTKNNIPKINFNIKNKK
jgi:P4 family phage/plasmid primase-like protien